MVRSLPCRDTASLKHESQSRKLVRGRLGCDMQGLLELVECLLQPWMPFGAVDSPMRIGPLAGPRAMPLLDADPLVSGMSILYLLIVDSGVFNHRLYQGMAKAGTIDRTGFRHKGCITVPGGIANLGDLRQQ